MSSNSLLHSAIIRDWQIKKFCLYGLLKNFKFFEAYLILFLMSHQISLFQIGILMACREVVVNLFEVPSGLIADYFGRKKELYLCFIFYIISFIIFFIGDNFGYALLAMFFFGLGEAFRSGTHKAIIYSYLDAKEWTGEKAFVYGRTRSFSLIGSAISSLVGIGIVLSIPDIQYIFIFSIIPYVLDLLLIVSYPSYLDCADKKEISSFKELLYKLLYTFKQRNKLRRILFEEGCAEGAFSYLKEFIQPIMELIVIGSGVAIIAGLSLDDNLKIVLGTIYAVFNLCSSFFSKRAFLLTNRRSGIECLLYIHLITAILLGTLACFSQIYIVVIAIYLLLYIMHSMRKPIFVAEIDCHIDKSNRATILSISSQIKSLFLVIFAPIAGFTADRYGIGVTIWLLFLLFTVTIPLLVFRNN